MLKKYDVVDVIVEKIGNDYKIFRYSRGPAVWSSYLKGRYLVRLGGKLTEQQIDKIIREKLGLEVKEYKEEKKYTREELENMKYSELKHLAKILGLKTTGKKVELIERILEYQSSH